MYYTNSVEKSVNIQLNWPPKLADMTLDAPEIIRNPQLKWWCLVREPKVSNTTTTATTTETTTNSAESTTRTSSEGLTEGPCGQELDVGSCHPHFLRPRLRLVHCMTHVHRQCCELPSSSSSLAPMDIPSVQFIGSSYLYYKYLGTITSCLHYTGSVRVFLI